MAKRSKRKVSRRTRRPPARKRVSRSRPVTKRSAKRPAAKKQARKQAKAAAPRKKPAPVAVPAPRLERARRTLGSEVPTPPSSLDLKRHGSAVRTGRRELGESLKEHAGMTPALTGGDVDADWENAYFSGEEAPGGDNPTPDQDVVEDIGRSLGVEYQDSEELKGSDKVTARDRHRWELDPASSEDYKERK